MPLTRPYPREAIPVARVLVRDVELPPPSKWYSTGLPVKIHKCGPCLRTTDNTLSSVCPMGLHKLSRSSAPIYTETFAEGECTQRAVSTFGQWFDEQSSAAAALRAIRGAGRRKEVQHGK